jgi:hypothetical protein
MRTAHGRAQPATVLKHDSKALAQAVVPVPPLQFGFPIHSPCVTGERAIPENGLLLRQ